MTAAAVAEVQSVGCTNGCEREKVREREGDKVGSKMKTRVRALAAKKCEDFCFTACLVDDDDDDDEGLTVQLLHQGPISNLWM